MNVNENQKTHLSSKTIKSFKHTYQSNGLLLLTDISYILNKHYNNQLWNDERNIDLFWNCLAIFYWFVKYLDIKW